MSQVIVAQPSDSVPPIISSYPPAEVSLEFDFSNILNSGDNVAAIAVTILEGTLTVETQVITGQTCTLVLGNTMFPGEFNAVSVLAVTAAGYQVARTVRFVAYDSIFTGGPVPSVTVLIGSAVITPGEINDVATLAMPTISVAGAVVGSGVTVSPLTALPVNIMVVGASVTSTGVVQFYLQNMSGSNQTISTPITFEATVIVAP